MHIDNASQDASQQAAHEEAQAQQARERGVHHELVRSVYRSFLGRDPDATGLGYWSGVLARGGDAASLVGAVVDSAEYRRHAAAAAARRETGLAVAQRARALLANAPLTVVDVGAQDLAGEPHVYAPLAAHGLPCRVTGFEPLAGRRGERELREQKQRQQGQDQGRAEEHPAAAILYPDFIGDGKRHVFHVNHPDATSSLLPLNHAFNRGLLELSQLRTECTMEVETSTLDAVLEDTARIDFLKLDIQGFELPALEHARAVLGRTGVVHCEVAFAPIYEKQALFSEIETLLRGHGFYFLDFSSTCRYALHCGSGSVSRDRLGWADAVFFKEPALVDDPRDLLAQVLVALLVYGKHSLAEALAERYDAQTQAQHGAGLAPLLAPLAP